MAWVNPSFVYGHAIKDRPIVAIDKAKVVFEKDGLTWSQRMHETPSVHWETTISSPNSVNE